MKTTIGFSIVAITIMAAMGCTRSEDFVTESLNKTSDLNHHVNYTEALNTAKQSIDLFYADQTRSSRPDICEKDVKYITSQNKSSDKDTLMYVFNCENNAGYVIVSADSRTKAEVLAITEKGNLDPSERDDNEGIAQFLDAAVK